MALCSDLPVIQRMERVAIVRALGVFIKSKLIMVDHIDHFAAICDQSCSNPFLKTYVFKVF